MGKPLNLKDCEYDRLTVIGRAPSRKGKTYWLCRCSCAAKTLKEIQGTHLVSKAIRSCGCFRDEETSKRSRTHGQTGTKLYDRWRWMKWRCSPDAEGHRDHYAAYGIQVCEEWASSFESFAAAMGPYPGRGLTLDRRDNDGNYEPGNCRWASRRVQNNNQGHRTEPVPVAVVAGGEVPCPPPVPDPAKLPLTD